MNIRKHVWQAAGLTISAGIYASVWVDPLQYPPAALITHCIPVLWFVQLIWLGITAIRNAGFILYPFLAIIMGLPFLPLTYASTAAKPVKEDCRSVDLLSYNVRLFRERDNYGRFSPVTKRWMETVSADIICLQEFSYNPRWQATDLKKLMHDRGYWGVVYAFKSGRSLHNPGLAVFSRFPIVNQGLWMPDTLGLNNGMYADIALNGDTLRCYNVHLRSPQLGTHLKRKDILGLLSGICKAAVTRRHQTEALLKHAAQSPFPVLLCGDFNEMPYSYNYFRLRSIYQNAFEQAGNGFGFTLNQWPYYLRIDHIFTSDQFKICHFQVLRSTDLSDHFPIAICICPELSNSHNNF